MKILQVITSLNIGGAEKLIVDMVPMYNQRGMQVDVLLFNGTNTQFKTQLEEKHVKVYALSTSSKNIYNPINIFKLIPILKKYDIIHTHNTACQLYTAIANIFCNKVLITTEHNVTNRRRNWGWYKFIDQWMYRKYSAIICISDKAKDNLCNYIQTEHNIQTIYNGINLANYQLAEHNESSTNRKFVIVMVAGFRAQKDQDTLIKAFQHLPKDKYELWLVGDGVRRIDLERLVDTLNLRQNVRFLGNRNDIPNILKSSDVIVMSSHYEGMSLSSIEGMAAGKPFVASDVPGLHEITEGAGILFPHENDMMLADIIIQLTSNRELYQQTVRNCLQRASKYDIRKTVQSYQNLYRNLFDSSHQNCH